MKYIAHVFNSYKELIEEVGKEDLLLDKKTLIFKTEDEVHHYIYAGSYEDALKYSDSTFDSIECKTNVKSEVVTFFLGRMKPEKLIKKPTLGIMPRNIFEERITRKEKELKYKLLQEEVPKRLLEINDCITRHLESKEKILLEWIEEYNDLIGTTNEIKDYNNKVEKMKK